MLITSAEARHACDQGDGLDGYTWTQFDAREGGIQVLKDRENNVKITTEVLMVDGGEHGGNWAARIKGEPINKGTNGHPCTICPHICVAQGSPHALLLSSMLVWKAWEALTWKRTKTRMCAATSFCCLL